MVTAHARAVGAVDDAGAGRTTKISVSLVGREHIFDDVTANNSNEYVTIKVDRHVVLAYT